MGIFALLKKGDESFDALIGVDERLFYVICFLAVLVVL